ncbi:hypothetical protein BDV38DRAFT_85380 [Aspergillus pseudotamarii]|uniref:Uncharacterized protein n=1 Tax=Aspergillus pseudotamarii TaxID=132259 RepID=A0A5N6SSF5_ASPPS|nr:uncharacterized protein BDV38DRAFT_85380 [Aspergillus pseudotamarii]KAE8137608.1 hypothetical protein BDV38DRAFT_85380 [Aspergillus pseudotamarii]
MYYQSFLHQSASFHVIVLCIWSGKAYLVYKLELCGTSTRIYFLCTALHRMSYSLIITNNNCLTTSILHACPSSILQHFYFPYLFIVPQFHPKRL